MNSTRSLIWKTVIPAMLLPFVASLFYFVLFSEHVFSRAIYAGTKVFTLVWPIIAVLWILKTGLPKLNLRDVKHLKALPLGLLSGAGIVGLMLVLLQTPLSTVVHGAAPAINLKTTELGIINHYWAFAIFIAIFHSLLEEYYWRWFVFGRLREVTSGRVAHVLGAVSFAAHHVIITTQFFPLGWGLFFGMAVGVGGAIFSKLYERQQTLVGAWIAHMIVDFGIMWIGYGLIAGDIPG